MWGCCLPHFRLLGWHSLSCKLCHFSSEPTGPCVSLVNRVWLWLEGVHAVYLRHGPNWLIVLLSTQFTELEQSRLMVLGWSSECNKDFRGGKTTCIHSEHDDWSVILIDLINASVSKLLSEICAVCKLPDVKQCLHLFVFSTFRSDSESMETMQPVLFVYDIRICIIQHCHSRVGRQGERKMLGNQASTWLYDTFYVTTVFIEVPVRQPLKK